MEQFTNILLIRLSGIGDILFTLPAVYLLRENLPHCRITYLTNQSSRDLLKGFPDIDQVITIDHKLYERRKWTEILSSSAGLLSRLRRGKFDLAVDFQGFTETALMAWMSGAPRRWGFLRRQKKQPLYTMGYASPLQHHLPIDIDRKILLAGGMTDKPVRNVFLLPEGELEKAKQLFTFWGLNPQKPTIFIQPFTNYPQKNWPLRYYLEYASHWAEQGVQIIFGGGPDDRSTLGDIDEKFPVAAGKTDLLTAAGLVQLSTLTIGGDTGLLHLAVALQKRILMLMGPSKPEDFGPYGHFDWTLLPERSSDLAELKVATVIDATTKVLRSEERSLHE